MSESIWKKEITFRRKPKAAPAPKPAKESVWKKEVSLRRAPATAEPKESVWRKEISLGRKRSSKPQTPVLDFDLAPATEAVFAQPPAPEPEPQVPEEVAPEPAVVVEEPQPYGWLNERLPAEPEAVVESPPSSLAWHAPAPELEPAPSVAEAAPDEPEVVIEPEPEPAPEPWTAPAVYPELALGRTVEPEPKTSFWRKERSLKRAPKAERRIKRASLKHTPQGPKVRNEDSFLRRERSLTKPKMSVPKRASGAAGGSGNHAVKRYIGLKVGSSQIAAARVANNGAAELLQVAREPLAQGVVVNGELRDPEALTEALKRFFARNKLPRKNVRLGIASSRIGVRVFDIAGIEDEKQLENAIRFRAQDTLPIPLDEAVLDYHILGESVDENGNAARRVLLVVAYRDLVDRYIGACRKAGVSLVGIDLEAFALLRALAAPKPADETSDAAFVAVAIGHDRSTFAVSDGRVCEFTRVIEWGGASLSVAVARVLDMAPSEVESIKRLVSLESDSVPEGVEEADYTRAVEAVERQVQGFARELVSSLQFYQGQPGSLGIAEIVITGGTANLAGLAGELERQIGVRVRVGDPLARMKVGKKISADEQMGSLAVAIGLGIED